MIWPFARKAGQPAKQTVASSGATETSSVPYGAATSLRSWEYAFKAFFGNYVPLTVDYSLYDAIREGVPFVDVALRKLSRMIGGFEVTGPNDAANERVNEWLNQVRCFGVCEGFDTFERSYVGSLLQYGKACAEIVLSGNGRDVYDLETIPAKRLKLIHTDEGLQLGEETIAGGLTPYERQDLFAYSALNVQGDNPHGTSLLRSLPFVANIALVMENAMRQRWMRHGAPSFVLVEELPPDVQLSNEEIAERSGTWSAAWNAAMTDRWQQQGIRDFFAVTQGSMRVDTAEPKGEPDFTNAWRSMAEQIVGNVELAPFMLGLQWSTTERLSQQQADAILGLIETVRDEIAPSYLHIVDWWARLNGRRGTFKALWKGVTLQDAVETGRADLYAAQAAKIRLAVAVDYWRMGWVNQMGAALEAGLDIEKPVVKLEAPPGPVAAEEQEGGQERNEGAADGNGRRGVYAELAEALWEKAPYGER